MWKKRKSFAAGGEFFDKIDEDPELEEDSLVNEDSVDEEGEEEEEYELLNDYEVCLYSGKKIRKTYKSKMLIPYVHAACLLSPHLTIMVHAKDPSNRDPEYCLAVKYLIKMLLLPIALVTAEARKQKRPG